MLGLPLTFAAPLVLTALAALPAIWLLLRITPPQPRRVDFPPLRILADLLPERETPARTPWWLLLLRLVLAAFLILAAAGPVWNPSAGDGGRAPLLLLVDNGFLGRARLARAPGHRRRAHRGGGARRARRRPCRPRPTGPATIEPSQSGGRARAGADLQAAAAPSRPPRASRGDRPLPRPRRPMPRSSGSATGSAASTRRPSSMDSRRWRASAGSRCSRPSARPALALAGAENAAGQLTVRVVRRRAERPRFRHPAGARPQEPAPGRRAASRSTPARRRRRRNSTCRSRSATPSRASRSSARALPAP